MICPSAVIAKRLAVWYTVVKGGVGWVYVCIEGSNLSIQLTFDNSASHGESKFVRITECSSYRAARIDNSSEVGNAEISANKIIEYQLYFHGVISRHHVGEKASELLHQVPNGRMGKQQHNAPKLREILTNAPVSLARNS